MSVWICVSECVCVSLRFLTQTFEWSESTDGFFSSLLIFMLFVSFFLTALSRTSNKMLSKGSESEHSCLLPHLYLFSYHLVCVYMPLCVCTCLCVWVHASVCVCVCAHTPQCHVYVEGRAQFKGVSSLPPCGFQELNSGHQAGSIFIGWVF